MTAKLQKTSNKRDVIRFFCQVSIIISSKAQNIIYFIHCADVDQFKTYFRDERGMEHSFFVLLIFLLLSTLKQSRKINKRDKEYFIPGS